MKADPEHNEDETSDETESPSQTDAPPHEGEEALSKEAIENMTRGMVYASLAITDDKEGTLKKVSCLVVLELGLRLSLKSPQQSHRLQSDWKSEPLAKASGQDGDRLQGDCVQALDRNPPRNEFETG